MQVLKQGYTKALRIVALTLGVLLMFPSFTAIGEDRLLEEFTYSEQPSNIRQNLAYALMKANGAIVIDVRTPEEYDNGHIAGAYLMPLDEILQDPRLAILKEQDTPVLLYCRSGRRSGLVMNDMAKLGFKNIMNMGGVITWEYGLTNDVPTKPFEEAVREVKPVNQGK